MHHLSWDSLQDAPMNHYLVHGDETAAKLNYFPMTLCHRCSCNPTIMVTINALGKSNGIQNLKITDLHGHLLFYSFVDPSLLAGVEDADDEDTSFAGSHDEDIIVTNADDNSDAESDHSSIDPNKANDNSSKASIHSTRSHLSVHSATSESPQHPPDEEDKLSEDQTKLDNKEFSKLETQVPVLCQSK